MKVAIINGTNRVENRTLEISFATREIIKNLKHQSSLITLENFDQLFHGPKITLESANEAQRKDIVNMIKADVLLFVVPTYHSGIPSPLKNFFDSLKCNEAFAGKVIGVISSNDGDHDYGARQAVQVLNGILAYNKLISLVVPIIPIINFEEIDKGRIENFVRYCEEFLSTGKNTFMQI